MCGIVLSLARQGRVGAKKCANRFAAKPAAPEGALDLFYNGTQHSASCPNSRKGGANRGLGSAACSGKRCSVGLHRLRTRPLLEMCFELASVLILQLIEGDAACTVEYLGRCGRSRRTPRPFKVFLGSFSAAILCHVIKRPAQALLERGTRLLNPDTPYPSRP